jgi:hypothetical protein
VLERWIATVTVTLLAAGCGTDAVGVSECREIEQTRCEAAASCGYPAVEECQRYSRDHCLHGVPGDQINASEAESCTRQVAAAGQCAASIGATTAPDACDPPIPTDGTAGSVCDAITKPESMMACSFLRPAEETTASGSGDASGGG